MSTMTLDKPASTDVNFYVRTSCPSNRRSALQRYLYESSNMIDDQVVNLPYASANQFNVVVTAHSSEFLANYQSGRMNSSGDFGSEVFDSLEAAMELPEFLKPETKVPLPNLSNRDAKIETISCGLFVASANASCILKINHNGNCRTR